MWTLTMVPYSISVHMCIAWHQTVNDNVEFIRLHVHCALLLCFKIYKKCGQMHIFYNLKLWKLSQWKVL